MRWLAIVLSLFAFSNSARADSLVFHAGPINGVLDYGESGDLTSLGVSFEGGNAVLQMAGEFFYTSTIGTNFFSFAQVPDIQAEQDDAVNAWLDLAPEAVRLFRVLLHSSAGTQTLGLLIGELAIV